MPQSNDSAKMRTNFSDASLETGVDPEGGDLGDLPP